MIAPKSPNESARLAALRRYQILDSAEEQSFDEITRLIAYICQTPIAVINLIDQDRQFFKSEVGLGVRETPLDISICAHAILETDFFVVPDTHLDSRFSCNPLVTGDPHLRFYAGALLETPDGHALGTLCVLDYKTRTLTDEQRDALQILARQVMSLMELRRNLAREHNIAETLQRSMLRRNEGTFASLNVETVYEAANHEAEIGGDFFDAFSLPGGEVALVVGDVSGKGLTAAQHTAEAKYALRAYLDESASPADALSRLNTFLCGARDRDGTAGNGFVVLSVAVVNANGNTQITLAGAESPLIRRASGQVETLQEGALPLGVLPEARYENRDVFLAPGDTLLLFTDGVTEARRGDLFWGVEGVQNALTTLAPSATLRATAQTVVEAARDFGNGAFRDDVCLLVARR